MTARPEHLNYLRPVELTPRLLFFKSEAIHGQRAVVNRLISRAPCVQETCSLTLTVMSQNPRDMDEEDEP